MHRNKFISHVKKTIKYDKNAFSWVIVLKIQITCIFIVGVLLMSQAFNGCAPHFTSNTYISQDMGDWGDFATCLTAIFALISIFYAYRAFRKQAKSLKQAEKALKSQINAAKRTSFDATFTQIFAQHKALHDKAANHKVYIGIWNRIVCNKSHNVFTLCREKYAGSNKLVRSFWENFNDVIGNEVSIDFRNYFKYIYHEINIVVSQPDEVLDKDAKRRYIQLIQAQMNYDELFCYFVNQVEYIIYWRSISFGSIPDNVATHADNLRCYNFFFELCRSRLDHVSLLRDIMRNHRFEVLMLINDDWLS